ncbi:B3 DNA binding domain [Dillenia turbinata]|uniref:B3 DNA binding domain n=1 Tax=Dillenia turbinata TaxID=194707 RepID=A0AAN8ZJ27_9MAGN
MHQLNQKLARQWSIGAVLSRIPPAFRSYIDRNLVCDSMLRGPTGQCWNVKVEVDENNMFFFRGGWENFAEDHSLEAYDFLTFDYDGKSQFDVKIYGKSTVEKRSFPALENPAMLNKEKDCEGTTRARPESIIAEEAAILEAFPIDHACAMPDSKIAEEMAVFEAFPTNITCAMPDSITSEATTISEAFLTDPSNTMSNSMIQEETSTLEAFPTGPACEMPRSMIVEKMATLETSPRDFATVSLEAGAMPYSPIALETINFEAFPMVTTGESSSFSGEMRYSMTTTATTMALAASEAFPNSRDPTTKEMDMIKSFLKDPKNSYFTASWQRCLGCRLTIPKALAAEKHLFKKRSIFIQDPTGKQWPIKLVVREDGSFHMTSGWAKFVRASGIKNGDTFIFEFASGMNTLLHAHIFQAKRGCRMGLRTVKAK